MSVKRWLYASLAASGMLVAGPAAAADAVALIMSVSGKVTPDLAAYSEISAETAIDLGVDGRVSFVHYPSCRQVTVLGGKLTFGPQEVQVDGGTIERETPQKCPKKMSVKVASGQSAAVRTRGFEAALIPSPRLSERPSCVLLGASARDYTQAQVIQGDKTVVSIKLSQPVVSWPAKTPALQDGNRYTLVLTSARPGVTAQKFEFQAAKDGLGEGECQLTMP